MSTLENEKSRLAACTITIKSPMCPYCKKVMILKSVKNIAGYHAKFNCSCSMRQMIVVIKDQDIKREWETGLPKKKARTEEEEEKIREDVANGLYYSGPLGGEEYDAWMKKHHPNANVVGEGQNDDALMKNPRLKKRAAVVFDNQNDPLFQGPEWDAWCQKRDKEGKDY